MKCSIFLVAILLLSCENSELKLIEEKTYNILETSCANKNIYVFDEYSCGVCFDNLITSTKSKNIEFVILYATSSIENFQYENCQLLGYIEKENIIPIEYSIVEDLKQFTDSYKGNYQLLFSKCKLSDVIVL